MSLKIWIAGCAKEERASVEAAVRASLGASADSEPWNVSLVKVANQWSVDIDGPEPPFKGMSLVASADNLASDLSRALAEATRGDANGGSSAPGPVEKAPDQAAVAPPSGQRKNRHECEQCASFFDVFYQALPDEPEELAPVACPHCWHVNQIPIAASAGLNGDYRAQAASV